MFVGPTWGHLGAVGPRWASCWPHESCIRDDIQSCPWLSSHITDLTKCFHGSIKYTRRRQLHNHLSVIYTGSELSITACRCPDIPDHQQEKADYKDRHVFFQVSIVLMGPLLLTWTLIPTWMSNCIRCKVWDEITYPFPNLNGTACNFISHFARHVIMYPCWD